MSPCLVLVAVPFHYIPTSYSFTQSHHLSFDFFFVINLHKRIIYSSQLTYLLDMGGNRIIWSKPVHHKENVQSLESFQQAQDQTQSIPVPPSVWKE